MRSATDITSELAAVFTEAGAVGFLHAVDLDNSEEVGLRPDAPVVLASVFKIPVLLELACQASAGEIDLAARVKLETDSRVLGSTGISALEDAVEMSVRDLATSMMSVSDNEATDVLMGFVGLKRIQARIRGLGLERTTLLGDCAHIFSSALQDMGLASMSEFETAPPERARQWRALDPERTTSGTARETTGLLRAIWADEAGPTDACALVRNTMGKQIWPHRLRSGFGDDVITASKTGTLAGIRNEAGVVHDVASGRRFAVAVFTREETLQRNLPAVDAAIGRAARVAVDHLRER